MERYGPTASHSNGTSTPRPYAVPSLLTVAHGRCSGRHWWASKDRAELVSTPIPLEITLPAVPCPGRHRLRACTRNTGSNSPQWSPAVFTGTAAPVAA
ncbi:MAG: hypothetical protein ACRDT6_16085 [Micromonosporaceae bacterium]